MPNPPHDRFDDISTTPGRVGAHRAEEPRVRGWTTFLWALGATIVLVAIGIFATMVSQGRIVLFPEPLPTVSASPTVAPVIDTSYSVLVLNGTPQEGLATQTKDTLLASGWTDSSVIASNASDRAFETTTVYYVTAEAEAAARGLAEVIGGAQVVLDPEYPFAGTAATQLTVVIGLDRITPDATEAPAS